MNNIMYCGCWQLFTLKQNQLSKKLNTKKFKITPKFLQMMQKVNNFIFFCIELNKKSKLKDVIKDLQNRINDKNGKIKKKMH